MKVVGRAVELIGSRLNSHVDDRARLVTVVGFGARLNIEFLNCIDGEMGCGSAGHAGLIQDGVTVVGIVVVDSIDDKVVVCSTIAVSSNRKEPTAGLSLDAGLKGNE